MNDDSNFRLSVTGRDLLRMIRELKPLLWFLACILMLYVASIVIQAIAPDGLLK
ncbi:hypothetical protein VSS37_03680 [Candidatus Thiothrix sp. Deng01]|uniref:Uncharacterized protein n=1 Tax=Candidatus Thiothrix phosphatis TaxID=3112415 RepID=A0ABU6CTB8_9GAMM|nr:hypothetical protein [Candidatus Thiothrix sp. Deng01]MEB4590071.1 hypothetical protein [Candidatus Thiothrix sp. Deng01]